MNIKQLKKKLEEFGDNVKFEHDLKKKNWFNIGGKSKVFYKADNLKKKKIGLILVENQKFFTKLII